MIAQGRRVITEAMEAEIEALAPRYPNRRALVLPALHIVNRELLHVPLDAVVDIAAVLGLPPAEVQDTLSFYQFFPQEKPHGKVRAFVCRSISCALRGGDELLEKLCHAHGIHPYGTTPDGELTIEPAECLGACDFAPCILANDDLLMNMTPEVAVTELKKPRRRAT
ncbi:MAG: NAD(P)H-dependent oxidoreductase subunit E [Planctomycetes bacterium]|nr:NAD(P)H-dependent oxidoreductase subunit E [Planctomycetota bacterium]MBM4058813.1 NAD(P)H-dependent oxidoreductase subunit E [Planctomycetota bacterium]